MDVPLGASNPTLLQAFAARQKAEVPMWLVYYSFSQSGDMVERGRLFRAEEIYRVLTRYVQRLEAKP